MTSVSSSCTTVCSGVVTYTLTCNKIRHGGKLLTILSLRYAREQSVIDKNTVLPYLTIESQGLRRDRARGLDGSPPRRRTLSFDIQQSIARERGRGSIAVARGHKGSSYCRGLIPAHTHGPSVCFFMRLQHSVKYNNKMFLDALPAEVASQARFSSPPTSPYQSASEWDTPPDAPSSPRGEPMDVSN